VQFNDVRLLYESFREEINRAVVSALAGGRYILGANVHAFEEEFAKYCGVVHAIGVASGTDAITLALRALGIRRGDEVLVPAVSAPGTAIAVAALGALPVFIDISPQDFTMDPAIAFDRVTSRTRAAVPVHLYGMPARLKELGRLGIPLLEDAAQAHGSDASFGRCGSFGVAAAFSFYPTKNLGAYGDGGMVVTSDRNIADQLRLLRNYGQRETYLVEAVGQNSRLDEIHAAVLRTKLKRLDDWNNRRRQIAAMYRSAFGQLPVALQVETGFSNYHLFVVVTARRDALREHLRSLNVPTLVHYPVPLHRQKIFSELSPARCPNADVLCSRVLSLPIHACMSDGEVERVIEAVKSFFDRNP
jgi:dTDP-4-amino-4,6-dideoxygalactose transaminase